MKRSEIEVGVEYAIDGGGDGPLVKGKVVSTDPSIRYHSPHTYWKPHAKGSPAVKVKFGRARSGYYEMVVRTAAIKMPWSEYVEEYARKKAEFEARKVRIETEHAERVERRRTLQPLLRDLARKGLIDGYGVTRFLDGDTATVTFNENGLVALHAALGDSLPVTQTQEV